MSKYGTSKDVPYACNTERGSNEGRIFCFTQGNVFSIYFRTCFGHRPWSCTFKYTRPDKEGEESMSHFLIIVCCVCACGFFCTAFFPFFP